jgi:hypothetical protein
MRTRRACQDLSSRPVIVAVESNRGLLPSSGCFTPRATGAGYVAFVASPKFPNQRSRTFETSRTRRDKSDKRVLTEPSKPQHQATAMRQVTIPPITANSVAGLVPCTCELGLVRGATRAARERRYHAASMEVDERHCYTSADGTAAEADRQPTAANLPSLPACIAANLKPAR